MPLRGGGQAGSRTASWRSLLAAPAPAQAPPRTLSRASASATLAAASRSARCTAPSRASSSTARAVAPASSPSSRRRSCSAAAACACASAMARSAHSSRCTALASAAAAASLSAEAAAARQDICRGEQRVLKPGWLRQVHHRRRLSAARKSAPALTSASRAASAWATSAWRAACSASAAAQRCSAVSRSAASALRRRSSASASQGSCPGPASGEHSSGCAAAAAAASACKEAAAEQRTQQAAWIWRLVRAPAAGWPVSVGLPYPLSCACLELRPGWGPFNQRAARAAVRCQPRAQHGPAVLQLGGPFLEGRLQGAQRVAGAVSCPLRSLCPPLDLAGLAQLPGGVDDQGLAPGHLGSVPAQLEEVGAGAVELCRCCGCEQGRWLRPACVAQNSSTASPSSTNDGIALGETSL